MAATLPEGGLTLPEGGLTTGCLSPCHGFTGVVEQWKTSQHFATYIANLGGEEVPVWTGQRACGNCHAIDGIEQRLEGNLVYGGTTGPVHADQGQLNYKNSTNSRIGEASYGGHATVAVVDCKTCHDTTAENDPHKTGKDYTPGSFPLRVPSSTGGDGGTGDQARIEKSSAVGTSDGTLAGEYGKGNVCIWCHKSRKDVTNYINGDTTITSGYWGPHEGPQSDIFTGKGGYHFNGKSYGDSTHQGLEEGCVSCHMPEVADNSDVGNHSFAPQLSACTSSGCHNANSTPDFDVAGGRTEMTAGIQRLRETLFNLGYIEGDLSDPAMGEDHAATTLQDGGGPLVLTQDHAGALYNYFLLARGAAGGIHNPRYVKQLTYDSIEALGGDLTGMTRP